MARRTPASWRPCCWSRTTSDGRAPMSGEVARGERAAGGPLTSTVLDFRPSRHGFHFANRYPPGPTVMLGPIDPRWFGVGDAAAGLCGGMSFTVRDLYEARVDPPPDVEPPANGSPRFRSLVRRQVESLDWFRVPLRFYDLSALHPDPPTWLSRLLGRRPLGEVVRDEEWPRIRVEIDAGRLALIGLVRMATLNPLHLTTNLQVVVYGYGAEPDAVRLGARVIRGP